MIQPKISLKTFHERYQSLVLGVLSRKSYVWPHSMGVGFDQYFLDQARRDGIQLLLHSIVSSDSSWEQWPQEIRSTLQQTAKLDAVVDWARQQDCAGLVRVLKSGGVEPVLLKGAALALTHYPEPYLRTRTDTDILVSAEKFEDAKLILENAGYESSNLIQGDLINYQAAYHKMSGQGVKCFYDLHAKLLNPQEFKDALTYQEVTREAGSVDIEDMKVKVMSERHMLLHACLHRVAHHYENPKLLWLYDIHLLLQGKEPAWLNDFYELAAGKKMRKVCGASLQLVTELFSADLSAAWLKQFTECREFEPSQKFLNCDLSTFSLFRLNLTSMPLSKSAAFLFQQLFPPVAFIQAKYSVKNRWMIPFLYVRRIVAGIPSLFRKLSG